jgi:hypothetical protein
MIIHTSAPSQPLQKLPWRQYRDVQSALTQTEVLRVPRDERIDCSGNRAFKKRQVIRIREREWQRHPNNVFPVQRPLEKCIDILLCKPQFRPTQHFPILGQDSSIDHQIDVSGKTQIENLSRNARVIEQCGDEDVGVEYDPHWLLSLLLSPPCFACRAN